MSEQDNVAARPGKIRLTLANTVFYVDAGKKGDRAAWDTKTPFDLADIPEEHRANMVQFLLGVGLMYHIKQAANTAETPAEAVKLMQDRWSAMLAGETGKKAEHLGAAERRALENVKVAIRAQAHKANLSMTDDEAGKRAKALMTSSPDRFAPWLAAAREQIERERTAAAGMADTLGDLLGA